MGRIAIVRTSETEPVAGYGAPGCAFEGEAESRRVSPPDHPLWLIAARVGPGSVLTWRAGHGEEAVYLTSGSMTVDGEARRPGGVVVVEGDARLGITFPEVAELVHVGRAPTPATPGSSPVERAASQGRYHLVGPEGVTTREDGPHLSRVFADANCPTCSVSLHWSSHTEKYRSSLHSHSQDELIHVLRGDIFLGRRRVGPGDTLAVVAHTRYSFESGDDGYGFVNYSPAASAYLRVPATVAEA